MSNWAHIHKGVVYLINGTQKDSKATDDVEITLDNCPHLSIALSNVENQDDNNNGRLYIISLDNLIEVGDEYIDGKFIINNDKFPSSDNRNINSYFEYQQYINEINAATNIKNSVDDWSCENAKEKLEFYYQGKTGTVYLNNNNLSKYGLINPGTYKYEVKIVNDTTEDYHEFDLTDALLELATNEADVVLNKCGYRLTNILSKSDISDL